MSTLQITSSQLSYTFSINHYRLTTYEKHLLKLVKIEAERGLETAAKFAVELCDHQLTSAVKSAAKHMTTDYGVVPAPEIGVEVEIWLAVFLGDIPDKA